MACPLCELPADSVVWEDADCRVIRVDDPAYAGFCRVVWRAHVAEMSDLAPDARARLMAVVIATEAALRELMQPDKINLASFGNMVPHLHWHVIPRFRDDRHFPESVWGAPQREGVLRAAPPPAAIAAAIDRALGG